MELGATVRDRITGVSGVATGKTEYITGCVQILVQPPAKDGAFVESHWFDRDRLEVVPGTKTFELKVKDAGPDKPAPRR